MKQEEGMKELKERIMQMLNLQISIQSTIIEIRIKKEYRIRNKAVVRKKYAFANNYKLAYNQQ